MGTFHDDLGVLHGRTVVVSLDGGRIAVGRYHEEDGRRILLHGADLHADGDDGMTSEAFLERAFDVGVWGRHPRLSLPKAEVRTVRLLVETARG